MTYIQGFLVPVPNSRRDEYIDYAKRFAPIWKEFGALDVVECWGVEVPDGKVTSFPKAVDLKEDETVVFSWIVWPSKAVVDEATPKMLEDPRFHPDTSPMPFDGQRIVYGGFEPILE